MQLSSDCHVAHRMDLGDVRVVGRIKAGIIKGATQKAAHANYTKAEVDELKKKYNEVRGTKSEPLPVDSASPKKSTVKKGNAAGKSNPAARRSKNLSSV